MFGLNYIMIAFSKVSYLGLFHVVKIETIA